MFGVVQKMIPNRLATALHTVKMLALSVGPSLDVVINFLVCFLFTEKLYIEVNFRF